MSDLGTAPALAQSETYGPEDSGGLRALAGRFRGGDLGVLPVVVGLVVIWTVMQILNPVFLSSTNLVNLTLECVPVGVIALGVGFMLLVGQIDLSVGSLSGMAAAVTAILFVGHGQSPCSASSACSSGCWEPRARSTCRSTPAWSPSRSSTSCPRGCHTR